MKLLMIISIAGFVVLALILTFVFTNASYKNLENSLSNIKIDYRQKAKIEAEDRIEKLVNFVTVYKKTIEQNSKQRVKDNVNFAINVIDNVYSKYNDFPKDIILNQIKMRLRDIRFFDNKTGYFFIYDLKGKCILLPTTPSLEGTNQINFLDEKKEHTIQKAIKIVQNSGEGFASWYWYKIGEKKMKKKIGFIKLFKPLGIFVGTARYEEDIVNSIKKDVKFYLNELNANDYGYIFAYDFSGNDMIGDRKLKKINKWNEIVGGEHIVRNAIRGAQIIPDGFFMKYKSKENKNQLSYIRLIPGFDWVIGADVDTKKVETLYRKQREILQDNLNQIIKRAIIISGIVLIVFIIIFLFFSTKIRQLFRRLEDIVLRRTQELIEQKNVFKKLFDYSSDGIALSKNKKIFDCNNEVVKIFEAKNKEDFLRLDTIDYFPLTQDDGKNSMELVESKMNIVRREDKVEFEMKAKTLKDRIIWLNIVATKIIVENKEIGYFTFRDITERKKIEKDLLLQQEKLLFQTKHDLLTSLPNRLFMTDRLHQCIKLAKRQKRYLTVLFLDIDNFKIINDAFGHDVGDLLLIEIASVLRELVRAIDVVSRFGGDEFVMVLNSFKSKDDNLIIINKIIERFQEPFYLQNRPFNITFSIGISIYPDDALEEQDLLKYADMAMYRAKNSGKNRYVYFDKSMNVDILKHMRIEQEIRKGIKNDEFILYYQPQYEVGSEKIVGFEALVRWQHPTLGLVFPDYFIQIAENSSLIIPLGELISKKAIKQITEWYNKGLNPGKMSINFTSKQIESTDFFDKLRNFMEESQCNPSWIEAELVERHIMSNTQKTKEILKNFKNLDIDVSIDDFGTGYSSLSYLKFLEISKLKIDKAFIDDLQYDQKDRAIAKSIIELSKGLELEVLAEGVETKAQYEILKVLGCHIIQGYYFSKPVPSDVAENLLIKKAEEITPLLR